MTNRMTTAILFSLLSILSLSGQGENLFDEGSVHEIHLEFESSQFWSTLLNNYDQFYPDVPYIMANAEIDGAIVDSIGVRLKGFSSYWANSSKKSIKLDFNQYVSGKKYDGLKKVNLNNGEGDPAMQRDKICYDLMREMGVQAPRTAYAKVYLNGEYWGLYLLVEQVDKTFLNQNFTNSDGNLFKNMSNSSLEWLGSDSSSYQDYFELKVNGLDGGWARFVKFVNIINNTNQSDFKAAIESIFDVDYYLRVLAVDVATDNWDSYLAHGRNYYIYEDPVSRKFKWIPWDYNLAVGGNFSFAIYGGIGDVNNCPSIVDGTSPYPADDPIFLQVVGQRESCCSGTWDSDCQIIYDDLSAGGIGTNIVLDFPGTNFPINMSNSDKALIRKILAVPEFKERYYQYWCELLDGIFATDRIFPSIEANGDLIRTGIQEDPNYIWDMVNFESDLNQGTRYVSGLKRFFRERIENLNPDLEGLVDCAKFTSNLAFQDVSINEFMASNDSLSGIADENGEYDDWIELYNNTDEAIDLSNAYLSDKRDTAQLWNFPLGTTIEANDYLIVWADKDEGQPGLHADFRLAKDGEYIQLTNFDEVLDSISYDEQTTNMTASRMPNGLGDFQIQAPTFNANNEGPSSVSLLAEGYIKLYPNPTADLINLTFKNQPKPGTQLGIYNSLGVLIKSETILYINNQLSLRDLSTGIYILQVEDAKGQVLDIEKLNVVNQ